MKMLSTKLGIFSWILEQIKQEFFCCENETSRITTKSSAVEYNL